ncbi:MAG: prepilin-type N-terminal cleavage/methylation domain-containing protein [Ilumatobacteraceae bacterium]
MENHIEGTEKQDKGFTLVELLIVIVILGILATVTVFAVRGITDQGKASTCKADSKTLQTGYEAYVAQYGGASIPVTGAAVPAGYTTVATFTTFGSDAEGTLVNAGFMRSASANWILSPTGVLTVQGADGTVATATNLSANGCTNAMI